MLSPLRCCLIIALSIVQIAIAQPIEVSLPERTATDDNGVHIEGLIDEPREDLALPEIDMAGMKFMTVYYSPDVQGNALISVLVAPAEGGQHFYIDLNNDEDLTNDGPPLFFADEDNALQFFIDAEGDALQQSGRVLWRTPPHLLEEDMAELHADTFEPNGDLKPHLARMFSVDATKGNFFFDDRLSLRRGYADIDGDQVAIGIYDMNENGLFDEVHNPKEPQFSDLLFIDLDGDGKLSTLTLSEVFKLDDVFAYEGKRYKIDNIDRYGRSLRLVETEEQITSFFVSEREQLEDEQRAADGVRGKLDPSFWKLAFETLAGRTIQFSELKGKYVLLNFWGEWCSPCLQEMPELVEIHEEVGEDQFEIVSLLYTFDVESAQRIIEEQDLSWSQVILDEDMKDRFKVQAFPTNLVILPDGQTYIQKGSINAAFIRSVMDE